MEIPDTVSTMPRAALYCSGGPVMTAGEALRSYMNLPALTQPHLLDAEELLELHHTLRRPAYEPKISHLQASAEVMIDLAHIKSFEGSQAEADELLVMAGRQAAVCNNLVGTPRYLKHKEYIGRLTSSRLLGLYTRHYAELGLLSWPDRPSPFQNTAYREVHETVAVALMRPAAYYMTTKSAAETTNRQMGDIRSKLAGSLAETVVLQCFNRLNTGQGSVEWVATPTNLREGSPTGAYYYEAGPKTPKQAFDIKLTFADQTYIPIEVKSRQGVVNDGKYDSRIARVYANTGDYKAREVAIAMQNELDGKRLTDSQRRQIHAMTSAVLQAVVMVDRLGESIYPAGSLEAAAAELSLWSLLDRADALAAV